MKVPEYQRSVSQEGLPNVQMQSAVRSGNDLLNPTMQAATEQLGNLAKHVENVATNLYQQQLQEVNESRIKDAQTKWQQKTNASLYDPTQGALTTQGENAFKPDDSGMNVRKKTLTDLKIHQDDLMDGLGNDYQKQKFKEWSDSQLGHVDGILQQHEGQQLRVYQRSADAADIDVRKQTIELNRNNPELIQSNIDAIKMTAVGAAKREGLDPQAGELQAKQHISSALKSAVSNAIDTGYSADAYKLIHQFGHEMTPDDHFDAFSKYNKGQESKQALGAAQAAMEDHQVSMQNYPISRILSITRGSESSDNQFKDGAKFYGLRPDGTAKGTGYLGELKRPDGNVMTEYTIGVNIAGKEMNIPSVVPTLSEDEKNTLLTLKDGEKVPESIVQKAVDHAKKRMAEGLSVYHDTPEPLTSKAGAVGVMQVMPGTGPEAAKLAGLEWDEAKFKYDPDYNRQLGEAYFIHQLQSFDGDPAKAWAAYNAGPDRTRKLIEEADKAGVDWRTLLPKETQDYVKKNVALLDSGAGKAPRPTLEDVQASAMKYLYAQNPNPSADAIKDANAEAARRYEVETKAIKQREDDVMDRALQGLIGNGGNFNALPATLKAEITDKIPDKYDDIIAFAAKRAKGDPVETDYDLFYQLKTDPKLLLSTNLGALKNKLDEPEFKDLVGDQVQLRSGKDTTVVRSAGDILKTMIASAGKDPTPKPGSHDAEIVGRIWAEYEKRITEEEAQQGGKLKTADFERIAARLFTQVGVHKLWGAYRGSKPAAFVEEGDSIYVPDEDKAKISKALQDSGKPVSEAEILRIYKKSKGLG